MVEVRWVDAVFLFNYVKAQILKEANKSDKTILLWLFFFFPKKPWSVRHQCYCSDWYDGCMSTDSAWALIRVNVGIKTVQMSAWFCMQRSAAPTRGKELEQVVSGVWWVRWRWRWNKHSSFKKTFLAVISWFRLCGDTDSCNKTPCQWQRSNCSIGLYFMVLYCKVSYLINQNLNKSILCSIFVERPDAPHTVFTERSFIPGHTAVYFLTHVPLLLFPGVMHMFWSLLPLHSSVAK